MDNALTDLEKYIKRTHRGPFNFEAVASDKTLRHILLTHRAPNCRQTLWICREDPVRREFSIYCKTLYEITFSPTQKMKLDRKSRISYDAIWKDYGLLYESLPDNEKQYISFHFLKRCRLFLPKEIDEITPMEDFSIEVQSMIQVQYQRSIVGDLSKCPLTISLLGLGSELMGVKASVYDPINLRDIGVYFIVDSSYWEYTEKERNDYPAIKGGTKDLLTDYTWLPDIMRKNGYTTIRKSLELRLNSAGVPVILYLSKDGATSIAFLEDVLVNPKRLKENKQEFAQ